MAETAARVARSAAIDRFLVGAGWGAAARAPLAGDASFRRYERVRNRDGCTAVLMDAPPPHEDVRPFAAVDALLRGYGYSAPAILASDVANGFLLLEDLGDALFSRAIAEGGDERAMYAAAVDLLVDLRGRPTAGELPPYDPDRLLAESGLFVDWYLPEVSGSAVPQAARDDYARAWRAAFGKRGDDRPVTVLRDYHADNLVWLPGRDGVARVGLLDFQDAVTGTAAYDLVSLLEDARRDLGAGLAETMLDRYVVASGVDRDGFTADLAIMGAQRNAKIIGIFTRLWKRDGKPAYLALIPRVWRHLEGDLRHPALAPVAAWFSRHVPADLRVAPGISGAGA
jgi:aminoglycoside/choline kinase family phosphotransferase